MPDDAATQHDPLPRVAARQHGHMIRGNVALLALATTCAGIVIAAAPASKPATRPTTLPVVKHAAADVVRQFYDLLKADRQDEARQLLARSAEPVRDADRRLKRLAASLSAREWDFSVVDANDTGGDVAVVLVNELL